ncbi:hypothetical protein [Streptomyces microflavus]|uniref:hypothetical protein n=1 Tax=Streptomyces microflavus TaxID=1919 RepID=UPI0037F266C9
MGAIENHTAMMYGYRLGGPADNWSGLANELVRCAASTDGSSWLIPQVSWETKGMREENHPDHFAAAAEARLAASGLQSLLLWTYSLGREDEGHIIAAAIHEPECGPLVLDPGTMAAASQYDAALAQALSVLELRPHAANPEWITANYYA